MVKLWILRGDHALRRLNKRTQAHARCLCEKATMSSRNFKESTETAVRSTSVRITNAPDDEHASKVSKRRIEPEQCSNQYKECPN